MNSSANLAVGFCEQRRRLLSGSIIVLLIAGAAFGDEAAKVQFNRDVRPILAEHCWRCHGPDAAARQAGLRLDRREDALRPAESGRPAIVPGAPREGELLARAGSDDPQRRMPPPDARPLDARELDVLRRWIAEGAEYQTHWSFLPIAGSTPPVDGAEQVELAGPIDAFVARKHRDRGLDFAPEADRATLIRRVYFDLIGLPPTLDQLETAMDEGYERTVDRLLASPRFGERMAVDWLDAARYADTDGYFGDKPRQVWLWRDWVIDAYNRNLPFDRFTIEQLAGDLLPEPSIAQRIATGFNRNHMSNDETGLIDEEYRVEYVADRVDATASTWLGLTAGCAQCHDHKYDPLSQREYYGLFAFFNNVPETGLLVGSDPPPKLLAPTEDQRRRQAELAEATGAAVRRFEPLRRAAAEAVAQAESRLKDELPEPPVKSLLLHAALEGTLDERLQAAGTTFETVVGVRGQAAKFDATRHFETPLDSLDLDGAWTVGFWLLPDGSLSCPLSKIAPQGDRRGVELLWKKGRLVVNLVDRWGASAVEASTRDAFGSGAWRHWIVVYDGSSKARGLKIYVDGRSVELEVGRDSLSGSIRTSEPLRIGRRDDGLGLYGALDELRVLGRAVTGDEAAAWSRGERLRGIWERPADRRSAADLERLTDDWIDRGDDAELRAARDAVRAAAAAEQALRAQIPVALVMEELKSRRTTRVLEGGRYDRPGEAVEPGVPAALSPWPAGEPLDRLGFARWLVARDNRLVARVAVNRHWRQCFGEGLVRSMHDFGTQGEPPDHPELLDHLSARFRDEGWDVKGLLRTIVTSRTYRQRSELPAVAPSDSKFDPENRWLARGPAFRLPMEMIRDQTLAASGLLTNRLGGPSARPYQPPGLWEEVSYNGEATYEPDAGEGAWRRSVYTFIKRQAPPPLLLLFDGPTREKCALKRPRTNTPLQALALLNDPAFVAAAAELAARTLRETPGQSDERRLQRVVRSVLSRDATEAELEALAGLLDRRRRRFAAAPDSAARMLAAAGFGAEGRGEADGPDGPVELAAWTLVVHTLFNLDETLVRS